MKKSFAITFIFIITFGIFCYAGFENASLAQDETETLITNEIDDLPTVDDILGREKKFKTGSFVLGLFGGGIVSALVFSLLSSRKNDKKNHSQKKS
ncbi:MAG: hypothetical protein ABH846_04005 [Patescibacteria group bacterium]